MPDKTITVRVKQNYGREAIYPVDTNALNFCALLGQATLTRQNLDIIKALGFAICVEPATLEF